MRKIKTTQVVEKVDTIEIVDALDSMISGYAANKPKYLNKEVHQIFLKTILALRNDIYGSTRIEKFTTLA